MSKEKLLRINRFNNHGNNLVNHPDGKYVLYSDVYNVLRDETAGANVVRHVNTDPDTNESNNYLCITSDKLNFCLTEKQLADAIERYTKQPWNPKPKKAKAKRKPRKKASAKK